MTALRHVVVLAVVLTAAGCGDGVDLDDDAAWRTTSDPVELSGLTWAMGSAVHFSDGSTIDTGARVQAFVTGGDGVFFVPIVGRYDTSFSDADLFFAAPEQEPVDTGLDVDSEGLRSSPDGTHLVVLDADLEKGSAVMRFFDLSSGATHTSEDGMKPRSSDRVDEFSESEVEILGIDDERVYVRALEGRFAYDLSTGEGEELGESDDVPDYGRDPATSPDGEWRILETASHTDYLVNTSGDKVVPDVGSDRWDLGFWADDSTVVGTRVEGPGGTGEPDARDSTALMTCVIPANECEAFEETSGETVVYPHGLTAVYATTYRRGSGT